MRSTRVKQSALCFIIAVLCWIIAHSCTLPVTHPEPSPAPSPIKSEEPKLFTDIDVSRSACAQRVWKQRGKAPSQYFNQIATNYHKMFCAKVKMEGTAGTRDALEVYGKEKNLINTYTLLIGLGLRESTGNFCAGRDASASNYDALTAEAGAFQSSFNSMRAHTTLKNVYAFYKENPDQCNKQQDCGSKSYGEGEGAIFQRLSKNCPQFAIEYNAILIRVLAPHFGPIKRKEAEFVEDCYNMLKEVEKIPCPSVWTL